MCCIDNFYNISKISQNESSWPEFGCVSPQSLNIPVFKIQEGRLRCEPLWRRTTKDKSKNNTWDALKPIVTVRCQGAYDMQSLPVQRPSKAGRCLSTVHRAAQFPHHDRPAKRAEDAENETTKRQQTNRNKEK